MTRKHAILGSNRLYTLKRNFKNRVLGWQDKWFYLAFGISRRETMPDFIIAGLPKTGTWWLNKVLASHPNVKLVTQLEKGKGELRLFSYRFHWPMKAYFKLFENKKPGVLYFEKSPDYAIISKSRLRLMKALNPDLKIILMFRDPVSWAFSHAKMDLVRDRNRKFEDVPEERFFRHYRSDAKNYDYAVIAENYRTVFGDNLLILKFESLKENPNSMLHGVANFIGVNSSQFVDDRIHQRVNTTENVPLPISHLSFLKDTFAKHTKFYNSNFSD